MFNDSCSNMNKEVEHPTQETETRNITDDKKKVDSDAGATGITGALQFSIVQDSNESDNHANDTNKCKKD
ncbi:hypothetical protein BDFB_007221 [Asbolus verrucosus]|uniref:Uncharacterized protein n=1 Tax=Asbolus verrucosus TaxID=1661398 RepID=A0A482VQU5_ASBVE|nr:hypothetical protein BDFB_007221 [Asbolus verrucosus]